MLRQFRNVSDVVALCGLVDSIRRTMGANNIAPACCLFQSERDPFLATNDLF